jgi:hypothetical protein
LHHNPSAQDLKAQASPDVWITEI